MITEYVIYAGRREGKTYRIMTEIHDLIQEGKRSEILVVFPDMNYLHWWVREWQSRFPHIPMVDYTSMRAMDRIRGKRYGRVFVEDIESQRDGIYEDKLAYVRMSISMTDDAEITFTCSPTPLSTRSHNKTATAAEKLAARVRQARIEKMMREDQQISAILAKIIVIADDKEITDAVLAGTLTAGDAVALIRSKQ